ncbi:MBL fold metallo-hydrolase, partial [Bacillus wiedmannii]|nr:MBL fold metallo-hydrolase [Bacillus wiedmannii]
WEQLHVLFLGQTFTYNSATNDKQVNEKIETLHV